jgi:hypothetical protein
MHILMNASLNRYVGYDSMQETEPATSKILVCCKPKRCYQSLPTSQCRVGKCTHLFVRERPWAHAVRHTDTQTHRLPLTKRFAAFLPDQIHFHSCSIACSLAGHSIMQTSQSTPVVCCAPHNFIYITGRPPRRATNIEELSPDMMCMGDGALKGRTC